jgi:hypothetical protein
MTQKIIYSRTDDITGDDGAELIPFGFGGTEYEIDLSPDNAAKFRAIFEPYRAAGRLIKGARKPSTGPATAGPRPRPGKLGITASNMAIRLWAREAGLKVSERGRIPAAIQAQYRTAHGGSESKSPAPEPGPSPDTPASAPVTLTGLRATSERRPRLRSRETRETTGK